MKALIVFLALSLSGCSMSHEEVENAESYCADRGLKAERLKNTLKHVDAVICVDDDGSRYYVEDK